MKCEKCGDTARTIIEIIETGFGERTACSRCATCGMALGFLPLADAHAAGLEIG